MLTSSDNGTIIGLLTTLEICYFLPWNLSFSDVLCKALLLQEPFFRPIFHSDITVLHSVGKFGIFSILMKLCFSELCMGPLNPTPQMILPWKIMCVENRAENFSMQ